MPDLVADVGGARVTDGCGARALAVLETLDAGSRVEIANVG
jgi:hypothetical protein